MLVKRCHERNGSEIVEKYPHWSIEKYQNYGTGRHVFIANDFRVTNASGFDRVVAQGIFHEMVFCLLLFYCNGE